MANYTIEARSFDIPVLPAGVHNYWVLKNADTGQVIAAK